ncbi:MAG TPA: hypothetical protein VGM53_03460 [Streptosporangiaceae bacterium]
MATDTTGILDEAYERLHDTGPEFEGWLSNHGPMAAEAMARHGHAQDVPRWLDGYMDRLEEFPRGTAVIGPDWREALGDPRRVADWTVFFGRAVAGQPWQEVLGIWWPRLLPGVVAAATHGVIRTGHAVRALLTDGDDPAHVAELAHGLAYWAARWQPVPGAETGPGEPPAGAVSPAEPGAVSPAALGAVPRIGDQTGGIRDRLSRLDGLAGWPGALAAPGLPAASEEIPAWLAGLADAAALRYLEYAHGNPVMLVHSATAPTAILRSLPALGKDLWAPSAAAAWAAAAALTSIYAPGAAAPPEELPDAPPGPDAAAETFARAVGHGDEHVIKFADTAVDVHARTGSPAVLAAAVRAVDLIPRHD